MSDKKTGDVEILPKIEVRPLTDAIPDSANVNKHTQKGVKLLENSMRKRGFNRPIAAAGKGVTNPVITAGNLTQETAVNIGLDKEAIFVYSDGTRPIVHVRTDIAPGSADAIALGIEDNRVGQESLDWDLDLIATLAAGDSAILSALKNEDKIFGGMLEGMGVKDETKDAEPQIDRAEELNKLWQVKTGDLWQIGEHKLICGDCTDAAVVARVMGGEKATLLFSDPPYGVSIGAKNRFLQEFDQSRRVLTDLESDDKDADGLGEMLLAAFKLAKGFLADDCSVFVCSSQGGQLGMMMMMMMMMMNAGLEIRHVLNWIKNSPTFSMGRLDYDYQHEPILFTWTKKHKRIMAGKFKTSTWEVDKPRSNKEHPTIKPVELYENAMLNHTESGDICFDNFCGSGTLLVACQNLGRRGRAIEVSPAYVAVCLQRMQDAFEGIEIKRIE